MASISSIQIYNAKTAYDKQIKLSELSKPNKTASTPANMDEEKISEDAVYQENDVDEKDESQ